MTKQLLSILSCASMLALGSTANAELSSRGEIRMESRVFTDDDDRNTEDTNLGGAARLEVHNKGSEWEQRLQTFQRVDNRDPSRNIFTIEEAFVGWNYGDWQLRAGAQILNWSATEAFHPADIVNSRNFDSNYENAEKIGEPMVSASRLFDNGSVSFFYMPMYLAPILPESSNRLSFSNSSINLIQPAFIDSNGKSSRDEFGSQWAAKFDYSFDDADISFHYVDHVDRTQPAIAITGSGVQPVYLPVKQYGLTYQHVLDSWVIKSEIAYRDFAEPVSYQSQALERLDHSQFAWGLEYGWTHDESGYESMLILEGQALIGLTESERAQMSTFQKDVLLAFRLAFNDTYSQEIFVSAITDLERSNESLFNLSYSRRLTDVWSGKSGIRWVEAPAKETLPVGLEYLHQANQFFLDISRHF